MTPRVLTSYKNFAGRFEVPTNVGHTNIGCSNILPTCDFTIIPNVMGESLCEPIYVNLLVNKNNLHSLFVCTQLYKRELDKLFFSKSDI